MSDKRERWVMPVWMERYRNLIGNTGGNPIEELMNDRQVDARKNVILAALIVAVDSQVRLLYGLRRAGLLADDYVPARSGLGNRGFPLWRHSCGNVEPFDPASPPADGGCDACESGSPDASEWQPLYLRTRGGAS